jgi:hypothetical protein
MNASSIHLPARVCTLRLIAAAALLLGANLGHAALRIGDNSPEGVTAGTTPELALFIWDPVKEVSYTRDLGINVYGAHYALGDTASNLFVYGQQDAGYQKLFAPLNSDPNFVTFLSKSTDVANQIWAVIAISSDPNLPLSEGGTTIYTTLNAQTPNGTLNPEYTKLMGWVNGDMTNAEGSFETTVRDFNAQPGCSGSCTTDYATHSSSYNIKGQLAYAGTSFSASHYMAGGSPTYAPNVFNSVGRSSWFYAVTSSSDVSDAVPVVDEFDNLSHDAYWGLGVAANGDYILSYTLDAAVTPTLTAAGARLRLRTDFAAGYGRTRLISVPGMDASGLSAPVAAVPEPSSWGLMALGLAALAAGTRRRRQ